MSTELQRQASSIRKQHLAVASLQQGRPSLFLTASEAAAVDVSTIHEAAVGGLTTLQQYDQRFGSYLETLLHPSSVDLQRETKTAEENKALDVQINGLLKLLSLYAVEATAHLVLEYLIRRYRIHEMNTNDLIQSMLVAHDTKIFARIVQLCKLEDSPWAFLQGVKTSGMPLPRSAIVQRIVKDGQLLEILSQYVQSSLELVVQRPKAAASVPPVSSYSIAGANKILSFYTAVVLELSADHALDDVRVRHLYLFLLEGLKNKYTPALAVTDGEVDILDQWRRACCMVLVQLSIRTPFGKPLVKVMSAALSEAFRRCQSAHHAHNSAVAAVEVVSTMCILAQQQKFRVGSKVLCHLLGANNESLTAFLGVMKDLSGTYNTTPLLTLVATALASELCEVEAVAEEGAAALSPVVLSAALCQLLSSGLVDTTIVRATLTTLLTAAASGATAGAASHAEIKTCVQCVAQRYAADFEHTVATLLQADSGVNSAALTAYITDVFAGVDVRHHQATASGNGLLLSLTSAIPTVRAQAMTTFPSAVSTTSAATADVLGLVHAAVQNLLDPIVDVALASWTVPVLQRVVLHLPTSDVVSLFRSALSFWVETAASSSAALSAVQAILVTAEDSTVLKKILGTAQEVGAAESGVVWGLQSVLPIALGALAMQAAGANGSIDAAHTAVVTASARVLRAAAAAHPSLSAFAALPAGSGKTALSQEAVGKAVTAAIVSAKFLQQKECVELLSTVATRLHQSFEQGAGSVGTAVVVLQVLVAAVSELSTLMQAKKADAASRSALLEAAVPLLLDVLRTAPSAPSKTVEAVQSAVNGLLVTLPADAALPASASVADVVTHASLPLASQELGYTVLSALLSSRVPGVTVQVSACLRALQPSAPWAPLLRIVLTPTDNSAVVQVSAVTRAAALRALAAYLQGMSAAAHASKGTPLSSLESVFVLTMLVVAVKACADSDADLRAVGLLLAQRLPALAASVALPKNGTIATEHARQVVQEVCAVLTQRTALIAVEPFAATAALTSEVFESIDAGKSSPPATLCALAAQFGWTQPAYAVPIFAAARGAQLDRTSPHMLTLIATVSGKGTDTLTLVDALVAAVRLGYAGASSAVQAEIVNTMVRAINAEPVSAAAVALKEQMVVLVRDGLLVSAAEATRAAVYQALLQEQVNRPGQPTVLAALVAVHVGLTAPVQLLKAELAKFQEQFQQVSDSASSSTAMDEEQDTDTASSGLSGSLQSILSVMEVVAAACGASSPQSDGAVLGGLCAVLLDFLGQLNDNRLRSVLLVDFGKALCMDTVHAALTVAGKAALLDGSKQSASTGKKGATKGNSGAYTLARVDGDIKLLLSCITNTKATTVQASALRLLKVLLSLHPASVMPSLEALGQLLAASSTHMQVGKEGLIEQILRTFVSFLPEAGAAANTQVTRMPQCMLQSLCHHLQVMPHHRRTALLKLALSAMKAPAALAVAVNVLLVHSFVAHEMEAAAIGNAAATLTETSDEVMILLSKSAQRRAQREMKTSVPAELFNLATELMLMRTPNTQVTVIIALLTGAHHLLDVALGEIDVHSAGEEVETLDVTRTVDYCAALLTTTGAANNTDRRGHAATIAVLHLQLILEMLENKAFHQLLVAVMDAQASDNEAGSVVQGYFMSFADGVLQLLATASAAAEGRGARQKDLLTLRIDGQPLRVSPKALGRHISCWCYDALRSLQRLMDGPTFVAIVQELIDHEQMEVRQQALVILGERLENMSSARLKDDSEIDLYLDLNSHLRRVVQSFLPTLRASATTAPQSDFHSQCGLTHSALMCLDVLARFLGKRLDWGEVLQETLTEVVETTALLATLTNPHAPSTTSADSTTSATPGKSKKVKAAGAAASVTMSQADRAMLQTEYCKLLGSALLCTATLCSVLGANALPQLPTIMGQCLSTLEITGTQVVAGPTTLTPTDAGAEEALALWRTRLLLVRSAVAAVGIIVAQISNFSHPYIPRILTASLALEGIPAQLSERTAVREDVDRCLSTIATKIPARLSIPLLLESAPAVLKAGHSGAARFADLLAEVWQLLDRPTVVAHLTPLSNLATLLLDYRRVFGDQSSAAADVDAAVSDAVVELCLKLTESELRSFLTKLAEWRDVKFKPKLTASGDVDTTQEWRKYARAVSYWSLTDALVGKLKSLFLPIMGMLWGSAVDLLGVCATATNAAAKAQAKKSTTTADSVTEKDSKKDKGNKRNADAAAEEVGEGQSSLLTECELLGRYILTSVRECCVQDNVGFVDEVRFDKMMQAVVALLPLQRAFATETAYLTYVENYIGACLSALTVAAGRDLLWKPMNHKLLMLTRDSKKAVRVAAVKVLHRLFSEVGDEYLLLLPECLPFLSELMEDSNRDVVAATSVAIRFIEELSGEKLDEYLQ